MIDEFGDISGLVSIEDLLEELVGEITDEHDTEEQLIWANDDGSLVVDARTDVAELEQHPLDRPARRRMGHGRRAGAGAGRAGSGAG